MRLSVLQRYILKQCFIMGGKYGRRTPQKWFIESVSLTPDGKKAAWKVIEDQQMKLLK